MQAVDFKSHVPQGIGAGTLQNVRAIKVQKDASNHDLSVVRREYTSLLFQTNHLLAKGLPAGGNTLEILGASSRVPAFDECDSICSI